MNHENTDIDSSLQGVQRDWSLREYLCARSDQLAREAHCGATYSYDRATELRLLEKLIERVEESRELEATLVHVRGYVAELNDLLDR